MNGGDAAEQTVRLAMEGAEFTLKIAGEGAEHILALLMAALKPSPKGQKQSGPKLRGRERLRTMLKSGAELKFFEIQGKDLKEFATAAKKYGITYCVLRQKGQEGGMVEIMAKAEDAARISRIMEKLEARTLGGGTCEPTKTKAEVKAEKRETQQAARQKQRDGMHEARQQLSVTRLILRDQYNQDIGKEPKPVRERRQPRTRVGQLLQELTTEIARHIPVVGALVRRREETNTPTEPERETPAQEVVEELLAPPPAREGQAEPEAPAAVRKEEPAVHPPTRTERTTRTDPPSAPLSQTNLKGGATISDQKPSVKADIAAELARRREQKPAAKPKQQAKSPKHKSQKTKKKVQVK